MASLPNSRVLSYEEWLRLPEVDGREEVVNGDIRLMPLAKSVHVRVVSRIVAALMRQLDPSRFDIFSGSFGLVTSRTPLTCREPDVAVFERVSVVEEDGYFHSPPSIAVEVLETRRSIGKKLNDYESIGIPEVWLASPEARTVEISHLENGRLRRVAILAEGSLTPKHFPHVQIDIDAVWPD